MNLGFDAKRLFLNHSGLGNYSRWLVNGLQNNFPEHHYHLYTTGLSDVSKSFEADNIHFHLPTNLFKSFWRTKGIKKNLISDKIDVYHGLSNELPLGIERCGIKTIVTIHDLIFLIHPEYYGAMDRKIYDKKFRHACEKADKIVAISEHTKQTIQTFYNIPSEKIEVIYMDAPPIDYEVWKEDEVKKFAEIQGITKPFLLNVGSIGGRKNQIRILEALSELGKSSDLNLILVGKPGKYDADFHQRIKELNLENRVTMLGQVNNTELNALYQLSYATIYPSLYEGFGIPIIESFRQNKPVITSIGSSLEEIAGKGGLTCNPLEIKSMANSILSIQSPEKYALLQQEIPNELLRFTPEKTIFKYMELYTGVMK